MVLILYSLKSMQFYAEGLCVNPQTNFIVFKSYFKLGTFWIPGLQTESSLLYRRRFYVAILWLDATYSVTIYVIWVGNLIRIFILIKSVVAWLFLVYTYFKWTLIIQILFTLSVKIKWETSTKLHECAVIAGRFSCYIEKKKVNIIVHKTWGKENNNVCYK